MRTTRRRSTDPSWFNKAVKKLVKSRKRTFVRTGGRTSEWKTVKKKVTDLIENDARGTRRCRRRLCLEMMGAGFL